MYRLTGRLVCALALTLVAGSASAQFRINVGGKKIGLGPAEAKKKLRKLDKRLDAGFQITNQKYGNNPANELKKLQEAEGIAAGVEKDLSGDLKLAPSEYSKVENRIKELRQRIGIGHLNQKCSAARAAINEVNKTGKVAPEDKLKALDDAVAALNKAASGSKGAKFWAEEAKRLRSDQPAIAKRAAKKAADQAAREQKKAVDGASKEVRAASKAIAEHMKANSAPISADDLSKFDAAVENVKKVSPDAGAWWASERRRYNIYNAFHTKDPAKVAAAVGGELVMGGRTEGNKMKIAVKAKKGWCYSLWNRWATASGGERVNDFDWKTKKRSMLQEYSIWHRKKPWNGTRGFCARADMTVTAQAELKFAGSRNGIEYALVGWPKNKFPVEEAVDMDVFRGDVCDIDAWKAQWMDPVPGNLVWNGQEPYLMMNPDGAGDIWVSASKMNGARDVRIQKKSFTDEVQGNVVFKSQVGAPKCPSKPEYATGKMSIKLAKCSVAVRDKYAKLWDKAKTQKERARTIGSYNAAKARLKKLPGLEDKEWNSKCGPTRKKINKAFEKAFNEMVDAFTDNPPKNMNGRAARAKAEAY